MAVVTAAARVLGSSRGLGQDGLLLLRLLGVRGLAISVSTWGTWSFPQGGMGCHRCLESVGYVQGVKAGLSRRDTGWENHSERTHQGRTSTSFGEKKQAAHLWVPREGDNLEGGRRFPPWLPPHPPGRPLGGTWEEGETFLLRAWRVKGEDVLLGKNLFFKREKRETRFLLHGLWQCPVFLCSFAAVLIIKRIAEKYRLVLCPLMNARARALSVLVTLQTR